MIAFSIYPCVSWEGEIIPGLSPAAAAMAARFAPPSPADDTTNCPGPCAVDVAMVDMASVVLTISCFILVRVAAVEEGVSDGDIIGGAGVATAGAKEMTVAVLEETGPRPVPENQQRLGSYIVHENNKRFTGNTPEFNARPTSINQKGASFSFIMCAQFMHV